MVYFLGIYGTFTGSFSKFNPVSDFLYITWPVWVIIISCCFSPWLFNPQSFQGQTMMLYLHEFLAWIDSDSGWSDWHAIGIRAQRRAPYGRKLMLFFGQKFVPRLFLFTCAMAALRIDPMGSGEAVSQNIAGFRSWTILAMAAIFFGFSLAYMQLAHPKLRRELFGSRLLIQMLYLWALRGCILYAYVWICWWFLNSYMNSSTYLDADFNIVPYDTNSHVALVAGTAFQICLVQALSFIAAEKKVGVKRSALLPMWKALQQYCDFWYREADMMFGNILIFVLLILSILPIGYLHSKALFNNVYAAALETMGRRRSLLLFVYSRFNLSGLWYFLKWCFFTVVNFCGWLLGLVGLRRCATSYLKWFWCTAWCWRENKEASYRVIEDIGEDGSGRFVPTLDLAERPPNLADEGPTSIAFLAKLNGPAADFAELCLRTADEMAPAELRAIIAAAASKELDARLALILDDSPESMAMLRELGREALAKSDDTDSYNDLTALGDGGDGGDGGGADEEEDSSMGVVRPPLQPWKSAAAVVTNEVPACPHPYPTLSLPQKSTTSRPSRLSVEVPARPFATLHPSPPKAHPTPPSADRRRLLFQARLVVCQGERSLGEVLLLHWWYPLLPDGIVAAAAAAGRAAGGMGLGDRRGDGRAVLLQPVER